MNFVRNFVSIAVLGTVAVLTQSGAAQALSFNMTRGVAGPGGVLNQGAFSDYRAMDTVRTIDFNDGTAPTSGFATYSFQKNDGSSSVRSDRWAPAGVNGEVNNSKYLAVFKGNDVTIKLSTTANYYGIDWGAISPNNVFSFYRGDQLIKSYNTQDVNPVAPVRAQQHGGEGNGFVHFYADNSNEIFDRIVISQLGGGGFESDNHTFNIGTKGFKDVPEPGIMFGLAAIGGAAWMKKRKQNVA